MTDAATSALAAARDYAQRGLEVFPLRGKMPAISTNDGGHGLHDATTEDAQLIEWFETMRFTNIGLAIPAGVIVMDVDTQSQGDEVFKSWSAEYGEGWMDGVPRQRTGNGGIHAWFRHPGPLPRYKNAEYKGIEMGRVGRYVIGAPSIHPNGNPYKWEVPLPTHIDELSITLPEWLLKLFADDAPPKSLSPSGVSHFAGGDDELDQAIHDFTSFGRVLGDAGWTLVRGDGDEDRSIWRHPSASGKQSATIKHGCLFVYSPNTPFPETTYGDPHGVTLFSAYAALEHGGDVKRAARVLKENGYLEPDPPYAEIDELISRLSTVPVTIETDPEEAEQVESLKLPAEDALATKLGIRIDWPTFWLKQDDFDGRWLSEPIVADGRAHALYAGAKTGKSLLMLQLMAALATGRPFLDKPAHDPIPVLYADYEMTEEDVRQRLGQFGYGPGDDLSALHYYLLGAGQALDTVDGGLALIETAHDAGAKLVLIDTTARAVQGAENDADTLRAFYRCSGVGLKRLGVAWVRVDHRGKDRDKGQRGTSAKNDDVDIVWRLEAAGGEGAFELEATHQRMGWVPKKVPLQRVDIEGGGIQWERRGTRTYKPGVKELAEALDALGAPLDVTWRKAGEMLRADGETISNALLGDALAWRLDAASTLIFDARETARSAA